MSNAEIEAAAATWFAKSKAEGWTPESQGELTAWLEQSTAHRIAFLRIHTAWERFGELEELTTDRAPDGVPARDAWRLRSPGGPEARRPPRIASRLLSYGAAAVLVLAAIGLCAGYLDHRGRSYGTDIGQLRAVALSDGSRITLDTASRVDVAIKTTERQVDLVRGDVYFQVAKDSARPFVVSVNRNRVVAVGTQFYVERHDNGITVLVTEGKIRLERPGASPQEVASGSEAQLDGDGLRIRHPTDMEIEETLGWRDGYLLFRDTTLAEAVTKFNRYTEKKMLIQDPSIEAIRIGGHFRLDDVQGFLWLLKSSFPIDVDQHSDRIVLSRRTS